MVTINGNQTTLSTDLTVAEYLEQNNYQTNRIVVELNEEILPKYLYSETIKRRRQYGDRYLCWRG